MNKQLWELWEESKYRVDFAFVKDNKFVHTETVDLLNKKYDAKEYLLDMYYNPCFPVREKEIQKTFGGCERIVVMIFDIATNKIVSTCQWWYK